MKIEYPIEWDERDNLERPAKGWLDGVKVTKANGKNYLLSFYDPTRLAQDLEEELKIGKAGIVEKGLIVIKEVTKENIEKAIAQADREGYFD
jgi:hypothetical protein